MLELRALSPIDIRAEQPDIAREGDAGVRIAELLFTQAGSGTELRRGQAERRRGLQVAQHQRRQHARLAAGVAGALAGAAAAGQPPAPAVSRAPESASARDVRQLWDAEHTWVRSLETADAALLGRLVDTEFSFIGPDGELEDREAYLAGYRQLAERHVQVQKIDLQEVKFRLLGDTAVVTGRVQAKVKMGETPIVEDVRFTRVYQRRGERWRMVAGQGTRLAPPAEQH